LMMFSCCNSFSLASGGLFECLNGMGHVFHICLGFHHTCGPPLILPHERVLPVWPWKAWKLINHGYVPEGCLDCPKIVKEFLRDANPSIKTPALLTSLGGPLRQMSTEKKSLSSRTLKSWGKWRAETQSADSPTHAGWEGQEMMS
jgi:hypothetical protein